MSGLSVYELNQAIKQLPDAGEWYREHGSRVREVPVETQLDAIRRCEPIRRNPPKDGGYKIFAFRAELSVRNGSHERWYDWRLL